MVERGRRRGAVAVRARGEGGAGSGRGRRDIESCDDLSRLAAGLSNLATIDIFVQREVILNRWGGGIEVASEKWMSPSQRVNARSNESRIRAGQENWGLCARLRSNSHRTRASSAHEVLSELVDAPWNWRVARGKRSSPQVRRCNIPLELHDHHGLASVAPTSLALAPSLCERLRRAAEPVRGPRQ